MWLKSIIALCWMSLAGAGLLGLASGEDSLETGFREPPPAARLRCFWWWLNGNVTKAAITRDLVEMKDKGFGGVVLFDGGGAEQRGNAQVPAGPAYGSAPWRELYRHALGEANRLGLEVSLVIQSGWNLGGPSVTPDDAVKMATWAEIDVEGPTDVDRLLPLPSSRDGYYRDVAVLAYPLLHRADQPPKKPIRWLDLKTASREVERSAPDCSMLLEDVAAMPGEEDYHSRDLVDISPRMDKSGHLTWKAPSGRWAILRFGYTISGAEVSTCSESWKGLALDHLDPRALQSYWQKVVGPLIADAGPLAGRTLKYFATDSWEIGGSNWTPRFAEEFRRRRGYDLRPYLPIVAGRIADSREISNRFLNDFRKTIGDCIVENHYILMREMARRHGIGVHPESGGPHGAPIDSLRCMGLTDIPMSEFWARATTHRTRDVDRFFVKQPASAAHTYGKRLVAAEAFTVLGPHWEESLWDNLKPSFDQAACEGLNRLVWCLVCCSPAEMGVPGQEFFAGAHFNSKVTWWGQSAPFLKYLNRCQHVLQAGLFVADVCYYYGDTVPNFAQLKASDPARVLPGYDYDVATEEVLLTRMCVEDGRIVLPDGMSYRVLVLPDRKLMPVAVVRKLKKLVEDGATVIGPRPDRAPGLCDYPQCDEQVRAMAAELWGNVNGTTVKERRVGKGRIVWGKTAREVLDGDAVAMDFEYRSNARDTLLDYIHRREGDTEIYFVCNRLGRDEAAECVFRVAGKQPELWDPVHGEIRPARAFRQQDGRTVVPLEFAPYGSLFVVFRTSLLPTQNGPADRNFPLFTDRAHLAGPWEVRFDPKWGGPESVTFQGLADWTSRPESGIRNYSGTATYVKIFDLPQSAAEVLDSPVYLDLGALRELASVRLNGRDLGVLWSKPFRVDVSRVLKRTGNSLEIAVTNFWPNRLIGDAALDEGDRLTRTNIRKFKPDSPLRPSGLLGPVRLQSAECR